MTHRPCLDRADVADQTIEATASVGPGPRQRPADYAIDDLWRNATDDRGRVAASRKQAKGRNRADILVQSRAPDDQCDAVHGSPRQHADFRRAHQRRVERYALCARSDVSVRRRARATAWAT